MQLKAYAQFAIVMIVLLIVILLMYFSTPQGRETLSWLTEYLKSLI